MATQINKEAIIARKQYVFGELNRIFQIVNKTSFVDEVEAQTFLVSLTRLEASYYDLVNEILTANTLVDKSQEISTKDFETFQTLIERIRFRCLKCKTTSNETPKNTDSSKLIAKLPELTLPTFAGDLSEWKAFIDQFNASIHLKQISKIEKLIYLRSLLKREALSIVMHYDLKEESYDLAYDALVKRYNNPRLLASHYINKILNFKLNSQSNKYLTEYLETHRAATACIRNLQIPDLAGYLLYELCYRNLSRYQQKFFDREMGPTEIPTVEDLFAHIDKLAKTEELHPESYVAGKGKLQKILLGVENDIAVRTCPYCKRAHPLFRCEEFEELTLEEKLQHVSKYGACKSCLGIHKGTCKSNYNRRYCQSKEHHTFLCEKSNLQTEISLLLQEAIPDKESAIEETHTSSTSNSYERRSVLLGTIQTFAIDSWGKCHKVRVICDLGSQVNVVTESLVKRLGLRRFPSPLEVEGVSQNNSRVLGAVNLELMSPREEDVKFKCSAVILKSICGTLPPVSESLPESLKKLPLADPEFYKSKPIDILLGADACSDIMATQSTPIIKGNPTALHTIFGYILFGRVHSKLDTPQVSLCVSALDKTIRDFWESEEVASTTVVDPEDIMCENHFVQTHVRDSDGRYIVRLPFRPDTTPIGYNLKSGWRSFIRLEERFKRSPECVEVHSWKLKSSRSEQQRLITFRAKIKQIMLPQVDLEEFLELKDPAKVLIVQDSGAPLRVTNLIENTSSFTKLVRVVAFVHRFVYNCRNKKKTKENFLTNIELKLAKFTCVRLTQEKYFWAEIENLKHHKEVSKALKKLNPFIDQAQLLRAGGRLRRAESLSEDAKHPLLLPKSCNLAAIICDYYHQKFLHAGPKLTQAAVVQQFWIISLNQLIRKRIRLCLRCYKLSAAPIQPLMGELPYARVNVSRPFTNVSLDFGGPIGTKESKLRNSIKHKSYMCVFVCLATKAVHIEAVSDLSSKGFLAALSRFVARRGLPKHIYSDCGRNFVGASRDLKENATSQECLNTIREFYANQEINWHFFPPYAPNFNGLAEGAIKAAKRHLIRQIGEEVLTFEEFLTLLCRIEAVLNSRPLTALSNDPNEKELYLSPAHFLIGDRLLAQPETTMEETSLKDRWERVQRKSQAFWKQWSREYLHTMFQRQRWTRATDNIKIGQVVFVKGENLPPLQWPIGRVISLRYGEDGVARVAIIRSSKRELCRPVNKLLVLPENK